MAEFYFIFFEFFSLFCYSVSYSITQTAHGQQIRLVVNKYVANPNHRYFSHCNIIKFVSLESKSCIFVLSINLCIC